DPMPLEARFVQLARADSAALFRSTERAVRAVAATNAAARALATQMDDPGGTDGAARPGRSGWLDFAHLPAGPVPEYKAKALLAVAGVAVPPGGLAQNLAEAERIGARVGFPVALKAQASTLTHKSEAGGVILSVDGGAVLRGAWEALNANIGRTRPGLTLDG